MNNSKNRSQYLRAQVTLPKLTGVDYFKSSEYRLVYEQLLGKIWREFIKRLENPIKIREGKLSRCVEVLGITRYYINHRSKFITCKSYKGEYHQDGWHYRFKPEAHVMVDPPFICNKYLVTLFVKQWLSNIDEFAVNFTSDQQNIDFSWTDHADYIKDQIVHSIHNAIRLSTYWKRLRKDIFNALKLDPEILLLTRQARLSLKARNLSGIDYNHVCTHLKAYKKIYQDAPNLVWLYRIAEAEYIIQSDTENPIHDLKKAVIDHRCGERSWRLLVNAKQRNFDQVIQSNSKRWRYLIEYLCLHKRLNRSQALSPKLANLFDHAVWDTLTGENFINYRDVHFQTSLFNKYINETLRRQAIGEGKLFAEGEAASVFTWLASTRIRFDDNQLRQPWSWFAKKAACWFAEQLAFDQLSKLSWHSNLTELDLSGFRFTPLNNAWQVRLEALKQSHCVDQYIEKCLSGKYRVFRIQNIQNKSTYTLGLQLYNEWEIDQVKGFANRPTSDHLRWLCQSIADALNLLEDGALKKLNQQVTEHTK